VDDFVRYINLNMGADKFPKVLLPFLLRILITLQCNINSENPFCDTL
jgi:hypothetical protein